MIDVRLLRTQPDVVRSSLARRHNPAVLAQFDQAVSLEERSREIVARRDAVRAEVNDLSRQVGQLRQSGDAAAAEQAQARSRALGAAEFTDHQRVPHWETATALGILDNERAVKISGAMFTMQRGLGATLSRALCQYALDRNADAFEEIRPPSLVTSATLTAAGQLPKFADDAYAIERDDLWCIPTSEVPLTSIYAGEVLDGGDLPLRMMAYSACYRREAGSDGRDTRGMLRAHEFDKVELLAVATPEQAPGLLVELRSRAEALIAGLGLPYRVIEICAGDLGQSHHRSFDIEVYAPGADAWLEVSSVSWFGDYQARRADIRFRNAGQRGTQIAHTLNGSALAVPRVWAAIIENFRRPDGSVALPEALHPYLRGATVIPAP